MLVELCANTHQCSSSGEILDQSNDDAGSRRSAVCKQRRPLDAEKVAPCSGQCAACGAVFCAVSFSYGLQCTGRAALIERCESPIRAIHCSPYILLTALTQLHTQRTEHCKLQSYGTTLTAHRGRGYLQDAFAWIQVQVAFLSFFPPCLANQKFRCLLKIGLLNWDRKVF